MPGFLSRLFSPDRGEPLVIVSGLPRSGTSMMMKMLEAGGVPVMTDAVRKADIDNPYAYYEYERVKHLEKETDKRYVREGRGDRATSFTRSGVDRATSWPHPA